MASERGRSRCVLMIIMVIGLVGTLALGGCSKKNVGATTEGESGSAPLQGFSKSPSAEAVKPPTPPMVAKADTAQARETAKRQLADIYFAFDKWALSSEGKKNLEQSAEALKQTPSVKLLIEGHCDERGSREYNLVLGEKRAQEARQYLESLGVKNPVTVTSFGKERPVCTEHDESCYWKNRRAHVVVEEGK